VNIVEILPFTKDVDKSAAFVQLCQGLFACLNIYVLYRQFTTQSQTTAIYKQNFHRQ